MWEYLVDDLRTLTAAALETQWARLRRWIRQWQVLKLSLTASAVKYYGAVQKDWLLVLAEEVTKRFPPQDVGNS